MPFDALPEFQTQKQRDLTVLRSAVDGLRQPDSWITGVYHHGTRHCAIGWLQNFVGGHEVPRIAAVYLVPVLPWRLFGHPKEPTEAVVKFNDRTTQEKVIRLFERAIRRAERMESMS